MAQDLASVHRKQLRQDLTELPQIAPSATTHVQPGATRNVSFAQFGLVVQAIAQNAQHGEVVALFGLFVNALDALPDAPTDGVRRQLGNQLQQQVAGRFVVGRVQIQQQLAQSQARRRVGRGQQRGPGAGARRLTFIIGFAGQGLRVQTLAQAIQRPGIGR